MVFRTLTRKSLLKFGKHAEWTVEQTLSMYESSYLRWVYYNMSHISFMDDILLHIGITKEFRIDKPGTNPEFYLSVKGQLWCKYSEADKRMSAAMVSNRKKQAKGISKNRIMHDKNTNYLRLKNQGH